MEQKCNYLTVDEFIERIEGLSRTEHKKLLLIGVHYCKVYRLGAEAESLVHDAFLRVLEGSRRIPRDVKIVAALGNIIRSVAGDHPDKKFGENEMAFPDLGVNDADTWAGSALQPGPAEMAIAEETVERIAAFFEGDTFVNALIKAYAANMKQKQIIEFIFKGDSKTYEATRRRFRRGITKIQEEGAEK